MDATAVGERLLTGEEFWELGDLGPAELVDGRIVMMSPTGGQHGEIELNLGFALKSFIQARELGRVVVGEVGLYTQRDPDRVRAVDVAFMSNHRLQGGLPSGFLEVAPELVVEIVSPSDRWSDVRAKVGEYFGAGVLWVWVVEPERRSVLIFSSSAEPRELGEEDRLTGEGVLEGFSVRVGDLFH